MIKIYHKVREMKTKWKEKGWSKCSQENNKGEQEEIESTGAKEGKESLVMNDRLNVEILQHGSTQLDEVSSLSITLWDLEGQNEDFFINFLLDKCPFCGATDCSCFGLPHGFQSQRGSLACTLSCLCAVILKVTTGATPAFSTNRSVHCIKCTWHGWPGSSHMHWNLNHQCSGELLSSAWLSQTRYWQNEFMAMHHLVS